MNARRASTHLRKMPAREFLPVMPPAIRDSLLADGFAVCRWTRPKLRHDGRLTVRVVFRRRGTADTVTINWTLCVGAPAELAEALAEALDIETSYA